MLLQTLLDARGISMYRLSKMSGVSKTVIIDICSGKSALENCTVKTVYAIAKALGCTVEELLAECTDIAVLPVADADASTVLGPVNYITGIHALNIPCSLDTSGDWHASALQWARQNVKNSKDSVWGDYGIEVREHVPENPGKHFVANHIRACLDLIADGKFSVVQGMRNDFISNERYTKEIFEMVSKLRNAPNWDSVRQFMKKEYRSAWLDYERGVLYG